MALHEGPCVVYLDFFMRFLLFTGRHANFSQLHQQVLAVDEKCLTLTHSGCFGSVQHAVYSLDAVIGPA